MDLKSEAQTPVRTRNYSLGLVQKLDLEYKKHTKDFADELRGNKKFNQMPGMYADPVSKQILRVRISQKPHQQHEHLENLRTRGGRTVTRWNKALRCLSLALPLKICKIIPVRP